MINIYDLLLNWTDNNKVFDFFEWDLNDDLEHIKRIPLFKIKEEAYNEILNSDIKVDKVFLDLIKNRTEIYNNKKRVKVIYATLLTDGFRTFAIEFNNNGESIYKSKLLLDEEEETINLAYKLQYSKIDYIVLKKNKDNPYETRYENKIKRFLEKEFDNSYKEKELEKLRYLYTEYFSDTKEDIDEIYKELKNTLTKDINYNHKKIYELLKLSYTKKLVK